MSNTFIDSNGSHRCAWCEASPELEYHDTEWGFPIHDDKHLFEKLCLESFQSGLSWRTVLVKRDHFRKAFDHFDFNLIAKYTDKDVERLLNDAGIVRHRGKISSVINNAQRAQQMVKDNGSLGVYFWGHEPLDNNQIDAPIVSTTAESIALSKDLKKLGWKFLGPTTVYAFMQSMGMVNDHAEACIIRAKVKKARKNFKRPT